MQLLQAGKHRLLLLEYDPERLGRRDLPAGWIRGVD
jgi:hypothetical protein